MVSPSVAAMRSDARGRRVLALCALTAALAASASLTGILTDDGGAPYSFTSVHGQLVQIYGGGGVYRHDSVGKAMMARGFDWANLFLCLPALALGAFLYARGRVRGQVTLAAVFGYFAYNYLLGVLGNAWNGLFLVWTALYSAAILGLVITLAGIDRPALRAGVEATFPRKSFIAYMIALALVLLALYLSQIVGSLVTGQPPELLESYTTLELAALELGFMIPLHVLGAALLWRGNAWGYLIALPLAFTAAITFVALAIGQVLRQVAFGSVGHSGIAQAFAFALVASIVALVGLRRVKG